ncbi:MAG: DUF4160 domain-containing protein [Candidatus Muirbacterium halophilum]|nr:DUF4160 domain-containing protein [Candidatus Muirbacterium halophilum]MCK9477419.1 DUF4160 domain-containing protein [Candidatus Muirbacterium halophilum]
MSPTILKYKNFRFYFNSREETRMHIHVKTPDGEMKIWLEPEVSLDKNFGVKNKDVLQILKIVMEKENEFKETWKKHFKS